MRKLLAGLFLFLPALVIAQEDRPTVAELAANADVIALVMVEQVDYETTRDFPSSGSGFLSVLIPYRGDIKKGDWLEVKEKGLHDYACYYPEPDIFAFDGARFLVMLQKAETGDSYHGTAPGCMIPVYVTSDNRYAVQYPVDGLDNRELAPLVREFEFNDPAAFVDASDYTQRQLEQFIGRYAARKVETDAYAPDTQRYVYTRGVPLSDFRKLIPPRQP